MIPRILHQFWVGSPLPAAYREFAEGWRRLHPEWEYRLWTEADLPVLRNRALYDAAPELWPDAVNRQRQFQSDVLRYELLEQFGGVWVDTDFEPLKPLDGLLSGVTCFAAWEVQDRWICNAIMGAEPGHPFIERLIEAVPESVRKQPGAVPSYTTGPRLVTRLYREDLGGLTVFPQRLFYPYGPALRELGRARRAYPDAYAVHHWNRYRVAKRKPL